MGINIKSLLILLLASFFLCLCSCTTPGSSIDPAPETSEPVTMPTVTPSHTAQLNIADGYTVHEDQPDSYKLDIVLPQITADTPGTQELKRHIDDDYEVMMSGAPLQTLVEGYPYTYTKVSYVICKQAEIYSISITTTISSLIKDSIPIQSVVSYYYDGTTDTYIPTWEEYIERLGLTKKDILNALRDQYGSKYDGLSFSLGPPELPFYFDEDCKLVFLTAGLDCMVK